MPQVKTLLSTFSAGELDPNLASRSDVTAYFQGCTQLKNFSLLQQGGVMRRPGSLHIDTLASTGRLLPFIFSDTEEYLFVFLNTKLRIYDVNNSTISLTQEITSCPWTTAMLFELNFAQYGDTMYVVHRLMQPQEILRTSATAFTVSNFAFAAHSSTNPVYQPYYKFAPATMTLTPSATSGTINLTTSAAYWTDDLEGIRVRYKGKEVLTTTKASTTVMAGTVKETLASTTADQDWDEQAFSAAQGYPSAVVFHEDRLWFAGTPALPNGIFASQTSDYDNFDVDNASASDAIQVLLGTDQVNEVRHLVSSRNLQLFTDSGEFYETSATTTAATPASITFRRQTPHGADRTQPQLLDGATLFSQKNGKSIREFLYTDLESAYTADSISLTSGHLINTPTDSTVIYGNEKRPEQFAFWVMNDGTMSVFHSIRSEKLAGWTEWNTRYTSTSNTGFISIQAIDNKLFSVCKRQKDDILTSLDATAINISNGLFTKTSHGLATGNDVIVTNNGGTYPSGTVNSVATTVDGSTVYFVYIVNSSTFYLHTTYAGAVANTAATRLILTSQGSGSFTISDAPSSQATCTITVSDAANIAVGSTITITDNAGTSTTMTATNDDPAGALEFSVGGSRTNDDVADNIAVGSGGVLGINALAGYSAPNPGSGTPVITVTRNDIGNDNLPVTSTDPVRLTVTNFTGGDTDAGTTDIFTLEQFSEDNTITLDCSFTDAAYANGTPLVKGESNTGNTLVVDGLTDQPLVGEQFTIAGLADTNIINGVSTIVSGEVTLTLNDALASAPADNAAIPFTATRTHDGFSTLNGQALKFASPSDSPIYAMPTTTIGNNKIVLSEAQATVRGGYDYTPTLETMPVDTVVTGGPLTGEQRRVNRVNIDLNEARNILVNNKEITFRKVKDDQQADPSAFTGRKEIAIMGYGNAPTITVTQNQPLEAKILGMALEVSF